MKKYIMAMDQGTTSSRCIIYDRGGTCVSSAQSEFPQYYPKPGFVEHDPLEIWETQVGASREALKNAGLTHENIEAIGITNQRETTIVWDRHTGEPVYPAIVWQCRRTAQFCDTLIAQGLNEKFKEKTGLLIDAYFSATKLHWILLNVSGARAKAEAGDLLFGTVETWLIWKLTNGRVHITDYSNASRTMLFNIHKLKWDEEILALLNIPKSMLPEVKPSSCLYGMTDPAIFGGEIRLSGAAGDQQAALFGQACFQRGEAKNTYGTGCFLLMNTGENPVASQNGLLTTIAWHVNGKVTYALEGSVFAAGAAIQWLRDELGLIEESSDSAKLASETDDTGGVYVVPAFAGLGAPYWNPYARGAVFGLSRGSNRNHLVRATLESIAYQTSDLIQAMEEDSGTKLISLKVDGGASANDFLMQFQADILNAQIIRPHTVETTSLGAAYLAGLAVEYWKGEEDITLNWNLRKRYVPDMDEQKRKELLDAWTQSVKACLSWGNNFKKFQK